MAKKEYCKFHNVWSHSTNNCVVFHNIVQKAIEDGKLKFSKKSEVMGAGGNPFPKAVTKNVSSMVSKHPKKKGVVIEENNPMKLKKIVLEKPPYGMTQQLKPLYIRVLVEERPMARVLVDNGLVLNVVLVNVMRMLGKSPEDIIPTDVSISGFRGGIVKMQGILPLELTVGDRTSIIAFFVIESIVAYNLLLGRKWIQPNFCIPSSLH
ncbi:uncharacterized protein LOC132270060 [Cornus florida]|uniref:uncharacterized protein LOC132270060 n=1 Tax=Cornus florida TaxID=4283 RepID=UPI0028988048|nr:uncharacterized protein LOC132270060 [Cornus florida]